MIKTEIQISIIIIKRKSPWFDLSHLLVVGLLLQLLDKLKVFGNQTMQNDRSREEQVTFSRSSMWYNNLQAQNALKLRQRLNAWGCFKRPNFFSTWNEHLPYKMSRTHVTFAMKAWAPLTCNSTFGGDLKVRQTFTLQPPCPQRFIVPFNSDQEIYPFVTSHAVWSNCVRA